MGTDDGRPRVSGPLSRPIVAGGLLVLFALTFVYQSNIAYTRLQDGIDRIDGVVSKVAERVEATRARIDQIEGRTGHTGSGSVVAPSVVVPAVPAVPVSASLSIDVPAGTGGSLSKEARTEAFSAINTRAGKAVDVVLLVGVQDGSVAHELRSIYPKCAVHVITASKAGERGAGWLTWHEAKDSTAALTLAGSISAKKQFDLVLLSATGSDALAKGSKVRMFEQWFTHVGLLGWLGFLGVTPELLKWADDIVDVLHRPFLKDVNTTTAHGVDHDVRSLHVYDGVIMLEKGMFSPRWSNKENKWDISLFPDARYSNLKIPHFQSGAASGDWPDSNTRRDLRELHEIMQETETDKAVAHVYDLGYIFLFSPLRHSSRIKLLEVGFGAGAGAEAFVKYFDNAHVHTLDINDKMWNTVSGFFQGKSKSNIHFHAADQNKLSDSEVVIKQMGKDFDIAIDDGEHSATSQLVTFAAYWKTVKRAGWFACEDMRDSSYHIKHWPTRAPDASMHFFAALIGHVQRTMPQHDVSLALARATREVPAAATAVDDSVFSVHFYHELVLVQKRP